MDVGIQLQLSVNYDQRIIAAGTGFPPKPDGDRDDGRQRPPALEAELALLHFSCDVHTFLAASLSHER